MKNYLLKLNIYATGHLFWYIRSLENWFSCCHWMEPSISPEFKGFKAQSTQIKTEKTLLIPARNALLFILVKI